MKKIIDNLKQKDDNTKDLIAKYVAGFVMIVSFVVWVYLPKNVMQTQAVTEKETQTANVLSIKDVLNKAIEESNITDVFKIDKKTDSVSKDILNNIDNEPIDIEDKKLNKAIENFLMMYDKDGNKDVMEDVDEYSENKDDLY